MQSFVIERDYRRRLIRNMRNGCPVVMGRKRGRMKKLSLYVHIPFCRAKCYYCDFLSGPKYMEQKEEYVEALCKEIGNRAQKLSREEKIVDTIFFGGGTPSVLEDKEIKKITDTIKKGFHVLSEAEISLEMNPDSVTKEKLKAYKEAGINRLSIGLQSANNEELKLLGRIHTWEGFLKSWNLVRKEGFSNVNIDLMSGLPGQTMESYEETLHKILKIGPEHISSYSLIVEEGTKFEQWYGEEGEKREHLPEEETDRRMYELTKKMLKEKGYERYEISNYSLAGYECKHNEGYWTGKSYLGFGLGASSYFRGQRFQNENDMEKYLTLMKKGEDPVLEHHTLSKKEQMEEFMFLGLRRMKGVREKNFYDRFQISLKEVYGEKLQSLEEKALLKYNEKEGSWALTEFGIDVSNQVFVEFL